MGQSLPISFFALEQLLLEKKQKIFPPIIDRPTLLHLGRMVGLETEQSLYSMTRLLHNFGVIIYFENDYLLSQLAILDPIFVTKLLASLITTKHRFLLFLYPSFFSFVLRFRFLFVSFLSSWLQRNTSFFSSFYWAQLLRCEVGLSTMKMSKSTTRIKKDKLICMEKMIDENARNPDDSDSLLVLAFEERFGSIFTKSLEDHSHLVHEQVLVGVERWDWEI